MPCTDYTPKIGETVFVSLSGNLPILVKITGFRYHTYLEEDVMEFERLDGRPGWSSFKKQTFLPEIPIDTPYLYVLTFTEEVGDNWPNLIEIGFFFDPKEAFAYRKALVSGGYSPEHGKPGDLEDYYVEVREVT